ncbi:unnamed protein product [Moneuplotes crassus]|uniref:Uncharacterized protein n=1 Tax=Euplotes crassus TaxID=5936 RepID=A0AAD1Y888_EUPCR|nr:unnamed protein product [Moneuplotes crassus]
MYGGSKQKSGFSPQNMHIQGSYARGEASELDNDPNSVSMINELLMSEGEWTSVPEILKLTMTAFYKVLGSHSDTLQEMGNALIMKANKVDLNSLLNTKVNLQDFKQTVADISDDIESKASIHQVNKFIESKLNPGLSSHGSKRSQSEYAHQVEEIQTEVREIYEEIKNKLAEFDKALSKQKSQLSNKADIDNINELLNTKANKITVAEALHQKANKKEIEKILVDQINPSDIDRIVDQLNEKANIADLHHLQDMIEAKTDRNDLREMMNTLSSPDKENVNKSLLSTLQREKDLNTAKIENLELKMKSHIQKIDNELKTVIDNFTSGLTKKADFRDLEGIGNNISNKADIESVAEMVGDTKDAVFEKLRKLKDEFATQRKDIYEEIYDRFNKHDVAIEKYKKDLKSVKDSNKKITKENTSIHSEVKEIIQYEAEGISSRLKDETSKAINELHTFKAKVDKELAKKAKKSDLKEIKNDLEQMLDSKANEVETQKTVNNLNTNLVNRLMNTKIELQNSLTHLQDSLKTELSHKCNVDEVNEMLSCKVDTHYFKQLLGQKSDKGDIETLKSIIDRIIREVDMKINSKELQLHIDSTRSSIEDMTKEIFQKAQAKDLLKLDEEKASREEMGRIFQNITRDIQEKVSAQDVKASFDEQALINEALCSENCLGRWVWKSGELKASCLIPWEVQCVNTCPDNFIWEKSTSIICISPGLYELCMGIFSKKNPNVQVQVNGEGIFTLFKDSDTIERHNSTKIKDLGTHSAGNITGLTHTDYISLPDRARVSVIFDGIAKAEGFISLKKL